MTANPIKPPKKLIEVALPLDAINVAAAREKSIRHGHPSTLHLWWARRPLAACRAVLFAQLVDDPSAWPKRFRGEEAQKRERERLHKLIERLVPWEASNDEAVLNEARWEIARSLAWGRNEEPPPAAKPDAVRQYLLDHAPPVYDPFCGGGSIPLEAQRLGLKAIASDLNPVAVMITKALVEFPPKFTGLPPVGARASSPQVTSGTLALPHKGWHRRGYLPHFDAPSVVQFITYRLADALPEEALERILEKTTEAGERRERVEQLLNAGHGACHLRDPRVARMVENALLRFDDERYRLIAWAVMPNHVHVVIETMPGHPLDRIIHSWKSFTAKQANALLGSTGAFWQTDYFDRFIRDEAHLHAVLQYVHENPVEAGLVGRAEDWPYSSATRAPYEASGTLALQGAREGARASGPSTTGETPAKWKGAQGLAEDVRWYGRWMRDEAEKRIGHLYPKARLPDGSQATVIAWLWARTVKSPNPAARGAEVPLVSSFLLSTKPGKEAWVEIVPDASARDGWRHREASRL